MYTFQNLNAELEHGFNWQGQKETEEGVCAIERS